MSRNKDQELALMNAATQGVSLTRKAAMLLLVLYGESQTETRKTYRQLRTWQFLTACETVVAQGIALNPREVGEAVKIAYGTHFHPGSDAVYSTDIEVEREFRDVLHSHRRMPTPTLRDLAALDDILASVNMERA